MPTVVYQQPDAILGGLQGLAGAFQGQAQGLQYGEEQRKFNEDLKMKKAHFEADLKFRISELTALREEKQLDRTAADRLAELQRILEVSMQDKNLDALMARQVGQQKYEAGENVLARDLTRETTAAELKQQDVDTTRTYRANLAATQQRREEARSSFALQREQLFGKKERVDAAGEAISKYGDPATWDATKAEAAFQGYLLRTAPAGMTTGQQDVPQMTPKEVTRAREEFRALAGNYPAERTRLIEETAAFAQARAQGEQLGEELGKTGTTADGLGFERRLQDLVQVGAKVDNITQKPPLRTQTLDRFPELADLNIALVDHATNATLSMLERGAAMGMAPMADRESTGADEIRHMREFEDVLKTKFAEIKQAHPLDWDVKTAELLEEYYVTAALNSLRSGQYGVTGPLDSGATVLPESSVGG